MKIKTEVVRQVCWDGWALAYYHDVEDRPRAYGEPLRVLDEYFKLSGQEIFLFKAARELSIFCSEKGIDLCRAFSADFMAAVGVFHCLLNDGGIIIERGGFVGEVASGWGARIGEEHYPTMEVDCARWAVLRTRKRQYVVERVLLRIPTLKLDVVETQALNQWNRLDL